MGEELDRQRVAHLLRASEERYRSVVAAMAEGVVHQAANGKIISCNPAAERLLGLSEAQMSGRTSLDPRWRAIHEDGTPFLGEDHPSMVTLRSGEPQVGVIMGVTKPEGTRTWISINTQPMYGADGHLDGVVSTFTDITLSKQIEVALRESEERYRGIVEASSEGIWSITLEGQTVFANAQMARMLGCTLEDLLSASIFDFVAEPDRDAVRAGLARRARGEHDEHEFQFRRRDGSFVWTSLSASPIRLAGGKPGALAMVRDISEAKRIQRDVVQTKLRLERALSAARMWAWETDPVQNRIVWAENWQNVLGLAADHRFESGDDFFALIHPDDRSRVASAAAAVASGTQTRILQEYRVIRGDGEVCWVQTRAERQRDPTTGLPTLVGTTIDTTELKRLEEQLVQSRKLEAIGRLAGGIAHDFNNLLTAILASVSFAERDATSSVQRELATIRVASERAADLTRQLLAFARKQVVALRALSLNDTIIRLAPVLHRVLGENIALSTELAKDLWTVSADELLLEQVLLNLVANARDALAIRGGRVRIRTANQRCPTALDDLPAGDYVMLTVQDDGPGLAAGAREHIFEPFYTTKLLGNGLGLASCYGSVKQLGGSIGVDSAAGQGASFIVRLPRGGQLEAHPDEPPEPRRRPPHETVLLVEDEEGVRNATARGLCERGYTVLCASDAEEALQLAAAHPGTIHALVTDLVLPRMNGAALAGVLGKAREGIRVLYVSGYPHDVIESHGALGPGAQLLAKPYSLDLLAQRLDRLLAG